ncbi:hypothetical protein ABZ814_22645 [Micromonospora musae]|uniref:hypothetical protein n=1 Tax=Micromonospora musae TaxID=1894970 RepID=UPI0033E0B5CB
MAERVSVDDLGIWVTRPHGTTGIPWVEVTRVSVYVSVLPPDGRRIVWMDATHVSGEFVEINSLTEGFDEAVAAVASRSDRGPVDLVRLHSSDPPVEIYRAEE